MNTNGYVVYPASVGFAKLDNAEALAAALSETSDAEFRARVEDCDTEAVVSRWERGERAQ